VCAGRTQAWALLTRLSIRGWLGCVPRLSAVLLLLCALSVWATKAATGSALRP